MSSFQVPVLGFAVRFFSLFLASLPQPFHKCLPSNFFPVFSTSVPLSFVRFSSASSYSALCSSFPSLPGSALQLLSRCPAPLSLPRFPLSLRPDFSCLPSRFLYSALLMVSFRPSLIRSRSCSSGAYLVLSLSVFSLPIRLSFVRFSSGSGYSASVSSFPLSSRPRLTVASPVRPSAFASLAFPVLSNPVSRASFPGSRTQLPVCFFSSFPASLPQLFHRCFPSAFAFGLSPRLRFLSSASARF